MGFLQEVLGTTSHLFKSGNASLKTIILVTFLVYFSKVFSGLNFSYFKLSFIYFANQCRNVDEKKEYFGFEKNAERKNRPDL